MKKGQVLETLRTHALKNFGLQIPPSVTLQKHIDHVRKFLVTKTTYAGQQKIPNSLETNAGSKTVLGLQNKLVDLDKKISASAEEQALLEKIELEMRKLEAELLDRQTRKTHPVREEIAVSFLQDGK